jgi:hypothetical protein
MADPSRGLHGLAITPCSRLGRAPDAGLKGFFRWPGSISVPARWSRMDKQTQHEFWILAIGTILLEAPVAFAAFTILSH